MDPRRHLICLVGSVCLTGCASPGLPVEELIAAPEPVVLAELPLTTPVLAESPTARPYAPAGGFPDAGPPAPGQGRSSPAQPLLGRRAIAAANLAARAPSREDGFVGGVQMFAFAPGRVYEVWTAPLRVTTLTLSPGETLQSKAAGDTVRWQIGEASSGSGADARTHVMLKPLQQNLATNLVLTTNRRVYLIELKSGSAETFNAAVAWIVDELAPEVEPAPMLQPSAPLIDPDAVLDGRYRIEPRGRRPRWTPTSVFNDGRRTFITFAPDMQVDEAPALFVTAADGERQMVNYRQLGGLFIVDRVFDRGELRLGDRRPQIVRIVRLGGART